jgi:ribonuclease J
VGLVLTHGHEDHIGAVPYLLRLKQDIPLIGSQLTLARRGEAQGAPHQGVHADRRGGQEEQVGPFDLEFVAVNHSIPDALAVAIHTDAGTVLATGDFKMDQLPLDGRLTDLRAFASLGEDESTSSSSTRPTPTCPASRRSSAISARCSTR